MKFGSNDSSTSKATINRRDIPAADFGSGKSIGHMKNHTLVLATAQIYRGCTSWTSKRFRKREEVMSQSWNGHWRRCNPTPHITDEKTSWSSCQNENAKVDLPDCVARRHLAFSRNRPASWWIRLCRRIRHSPEHEMLLWPTPHVASVLPVCRWHLDIQTDRKSRQLPRTSPDIPRHQYSWFQMWRKSRCKYGTLVASQSTKPITSAALTIKMYLE